MKRSCASPASTPTRKRKDQVSSQKGLESGTYATGYSHRPVPDHRVAGTPGQEAGVRPLRHRLWFNQKLTQEQINVRARCRELFYRVLAGEHLVKIAAENLESAKKLLDIAEKRVRLGESRPIELVKARVEFFSLEREYDKAKTTLAGDRQVLRQFLGGALPADFALSGEGRSY